MLIEYPPSCTKIVVTKPEGGDEKKKVYSLATKDLALLQNQTVRHLDYIAFTPTPYLEYRVVDEREENVNCVWYNSHSRIILGVIIQSLPPLPCSFGSLEDCSSAAKRKTPWIIPQSAKVRKAPGNISRLKEHGHIHFCGRTRSQAMGQWATTSHHDLPRLKQTYQARPLSSSNVERTFIHAP